MVFFDTPSGKLNVLEVPSKAPATGRSILCIHGFCCDAQIFSYSASKLAAAGFNVYSLDLPGHGLSSGPRGDLEFDTCLKSIDIVVSGIKKKSSEVFLFAHSMGSTYALWYAHGFRNSVSGLVLLSPYIRIPRIKRSDAEPSPAAFLYLLLGRMIAPRKRVDIRQVLPGYARIGGTQYQRMARIESVNFLYSFRYLIDIVAQRNGKLAQLADISAPVYVMYGLKDRNVYPEVSEYFFKLLKGEGNEIRSFDCNHWFYDALFYSQSDEYSEADRVQFISSIACWLDKISKKAIT